MKKMVETNNQVTYSLKSVDSKTIKSFVENMYKIIREESKARLSESDLSALRKSIFLENGFNHDSPLFERAVEKANIKMSETKLPILMINKLNRDALEVIFKEMQAYFKCNSFSKLMRYLAITNSFMVNEYIKNKTASQLCLRFAQQ